MNAASLDPLVQRLPSHAQPPVYATAVSDGQTPPPGPGGFAAQLLGAAQAQRRQAESAARPLGEPQRSGQNGQFDAAAAAAPRSVAPLPGPAAQRLSSALPPAPRPFSAAQNSAPPSEPIRLQPQVGGVGLDVRAEASPSLGTPDPAASDARPGTHLSADAAASAPRVPPQPRSSAPAVDALGMSSPAPRRCAGPPAASAGAAVTELFGGHDEALSLVAPAQLATPRADASPPPTSWRFGQMAPELDAGDDPGCALSWLAPQLPHQPAALQGHDADQFAPPAAAPDVSPAGAIAEATWDVDAQRRWDQALAALVVRPAAHPPRFAERLADNLADRSAPAPTAAPGDAPAVLPGHPEAANVATAMGTLAALSAPDAATRLMLRPGSTHELPLFARGVVEPPRGTDGAAGADGVAGGGSFLQAGPPPAGSDQARLMQAGSERPDAAELGSAGRETSAPFSGQGDTRAGGGLADDTDNDGNLKAAAVGPRVRKYTAATAADVAASGGLTPAAEQLAQQSSAVAAADPAILRPRGSGSVPTSDASFGGRAASGSQLLSRDATQASAGEPAPGQHAGAPADLHAAAAGKEGKISGTIHVPGRLSGADPASEMGRHKLFANPDAAPWAGAQTQSADLGGAMDLQPSTHAPAAEPPQAAAPAALVTPARLSAQLAQNLSDGARRIQLRVAPPGLGTLEIGVHLQGAQVHLTVRGEQPELARLLQAGRSDLQQHLQEHGLDLGTTDFRGGQQPGAEPHQGRPDAFAAAARPAVRGVQPPRAALSAASHASGAHVIHVLL